MSIRPSVWVSQCRFVDLRDRDRVRITAQLINARTDEHVWSRSFDRTIRDVLTLQAAMATEIAREVRGVVALATSELQSSPSRDPVDPEAYDLYLRGRQAWNARAGPGLSQAPHYFEESIARDPLFALAYSGLADVHTLTALPATTEKAKTAAERAVELGPTLAEAHASLATVHHRFDQDVAAADREFRRALELNPGHANAHQWYAILLAEEGRADEALRHARTALSLDPLTPAMRQTLALVHYFGRRFDGAAVEARRALQLQPSLPVAREMLFRALLASGSHQKVIDEVNTSTEPRGAELIANLSIAYRRAGDVARSDGLFRELQAMRPSPVNSMARWYAAVGQGEAALALMERSRDNWNFQQIKGDPVFDGIRDSPRFRALAQRGH